MISKFADDMKVGGKLLRNIQDLGQMESWADHGWVDFNPGKCEVMRFGKSKRGRTCAVSGKVLGNIDLQMGLNMAR